MRRTHVVQPYFFLFSQPNEKKGAGIDFPV